MSFLKWELRNQKLLEAEVDIDNFIEDQGVTDDAIIYEIIFDKSVYKTEAEVKEFLRDKYYESDNIVDNGKTFSGHVATPSQLDLDTSIEIELRRGVVVKAADLRRVIPNTSIGFTEKGLSYDLSISTKEIQLTEGLPHTIEICRVIEGEHANYGPIKITENDLESMERNFKDKITGVDLAINEDHKKNEAFGWIKDVFRSFDEQVLYGQVVWNTKGTAALSEKLYRYFSPEFRFSYSHPHTGEAHGTTLVGGALTNYPFLKMDAITELNNKNQKPEDSKMSEKTISLSDHQAQVIDLNSKITEFQLAETVFKNTIASLNEETKNLSSKVTTLEEKISKQEKTAKHDLLFSEGKINAAQKKALDEGKDMLDVLALSSKMNDKPKGDGTTETTVELSEKDLAMAKKMGLAPEVYAKHNMLGGE